MSRPPPTRREIAEERDALLGLVSGRHQRRYLRSRILREQARELTTALLRADIEARTAPARPEPAPEVDHERDDDERRDRGRWWDR